MPTHNGSPPSPRATHREGSAPSASLPHCAAGGWGALSGGPIAVMRCPGSVRVIQGRAVSCFAGPAWAAEPKRQSQAPEPAL
jgi:hypothetical protein